MAINLKLIKEISQHYKAYVKSYSAMPKPKPAKPKLKLPTIHRKYANLENLLESKISAYDLRAIFDAIINSDHPMLIEPLENLITIAKLSLNIDFSIRNAVSAAENRYQINHERYLERLTEWSDQKNAIENQYKNASELLRTSWNKFIDELEFKYDGKLVSNPTVDDINIMSKLITDRYMAQNPDGIYIIKRKKSLRKVHSGYINEMLVSLSNSIKPTPKPTSKPKGRKKK